MEPDPSALPDPDVIRLRLGCFDGNPGVRPGFHIVVDSKAPWHEITDDLPQLDEVPQPPPRARAD